MKYKIGDKVKIKKMGHNESDLVGETGIIDYISIDYISEQPKDRFPYRVRTEKDYDWYGTSQIELVKENTPKTIYVISSHEFTTLEQVKKQLGKWMDEGTLSTDAKVYKIEKEIPYEIKKEVKFR